MSGMYDIKHCTINYLNETRGHSGILFGERHVLTSANYILSHIPNGNKNLTDVIERLSSQELLDFEAVRGAFRHFQGMKVVYIDHKNKLQETKGRIRFLFNIRNARTVLGKILSGFQTNNQGEIDSSRLSIILSTFLLITIRNDDTSLESKSEIQGNIMRHSGSPARFNKGDTVHTRTTPFGHHSFFETKNHGIISNILDETAVVIILSMPLCPGSEGGGVFSTKDKLIGVILTAEVLYNNNDNVHLTLGLHFDELLNELAQQSPYESNGMSYVPLRNSLTRRDHVPFERSVVMVDTGSNWGCGVFVTFRNHHVILTCSHVLLNASRTEIVWERGTFTPHMIYKTEDIFHPYDIALLAIPSRVKIPQEHFVSLARYRPAVGSKVFCIGFPLFSSLANRTNFSPSIFNGYVTKYSPGIMWTDAQVQAGQSGGPVFDALGHLLGICVSNTRDEVTEKVFPNVNMAIPMCDIFKTLEAFFESGERKHLEKLKVDEDIKIKWDLEAQPFSSKL